MADTSNFNTEDKIEDYVQKEIEKLGDNPTLTEAVGLILRQSAKAESEARKASLKLEQDVAKALKTVQSNQADIKFLNERVDKSNKVIESVRGDHQIMEARLGQVEAFISKAYYLACENRQRNSKGNFIVSRRHVPSYRTGENLVFITRNIVVSLSN